MFSLRLIGSGGVDAKMIRHIGFIFIIIFLLGTMAGCASSKQTNQMKKVGLLVPETINDQVWGTKGYKGLLKIQSEYDVDVFYKESMDTQEKIIAAVQEYSENDVNLIFGHGSEYSHIFNELAGDFPDIHFVSFNGDATEANTTSLQFEAYAMGYFAGMVAANQSSTKVLGMVASFDWQPEIQGFIDGATFQDNQSNVLVKYTNDWNDTALAVELLDELLEENVDVVYPAGDSYSVVLIEKLKEKGLFAIGFVSDQSDLGESTVLTSTVQHADKLYSVVARRLALGKLESGNLTFDFQDGVITMGKYSPVVPKEFQKEMEGYVQDYINTGKLPNKGVE